MCGFTVYTGGDLATKLRFGHEAYAIKHRGPDNTLEQDLPRGWMAFHRLSIMDVSDAGNQPFVSGDIYLTCNGEIFNSPIFFLPFQERQRLRVHHPAPGGQGTAGDGARAGR